MQCNARFIDNGLSKCVTPIIDYELELLNGTHAGLEISRITDDGLLNMSASAAKLDWSMTKTRYLWYLGVAGRPRRLPDLHRECDELLSFLERHDVLMFSNTVLPEGEARGAAQRLLELGVITAIANGDCNEQRVKIHPS